MPDDEFIKLFNESNSFADIIRKLNLNVCGAQYDAVRWKVKQLGLDPSKFDKTKYRNAMLQKVRKDLSDILVENSSYTCFFRLKKRLIAENLLKYECALCQLIDWKGLPISLQLDHKNGNDSDHRLENLRLLCPNCHSQTENYAGRNKR